MRTIYRYELPIVDRPVVQMPADAVILPSPPSPRGHSIEIWAEVDDQEPLEPRAFRIVGTGNPIPEDARQFVGTVVTHGGQYVWHVFEATGDA
ncbi:MAG: DUF7352 domain-containing protein [Sciscionella sp.]